ncbi:hypothetical protein CPT_Mater93 [Bacillus phage Mater]|uniref:Uncharacterized protein n=1 Tax=Bacillus phage Mater TaxID=1540090 RepID=A0A0A0RMG5_9CAUD|nr:hypothetical protein CPT_Mater93 [Bacillus phage Mater]AIW03250.1 hypothetical protein CPT_Mater93 [Bacillus phage Mater]
MKEKGKLNLVKYAGEYWVTLAEFTNTRDVEGYNNHASVKSAIRTFVVRQSPDKYIAFRGEAQLKNIIQENRNNELFNPDDFGGTRVALIHLSMLEPLEERFKVAKSQEKEFNLFLEQVEDLVETEANQVKADTEVNDISSGQSIVIRQLRQELSRLEKEIEIRQNNREKIMAAINAVSSLEIEAME